MNPRSLILRLVVGSVVGLAGCQEAPAPAPPTATTPPPSDASKTQKDQPVNAPSLKLQ